MSRDTSPPANQTVLSKLMVRLERAQKLDKATRRRYTNAGTLPTRTISSTNKRRGTKRPARLTDCRSWYDHSYSPAYTKDSNLSIDNKNTRGDAGQPWCTPRSTPKGADNSLSTTIY